MIEPKIHLSAQENLKDLPLHTVLYECFTKNVNMPTDLGSLVVYVALFVITCYAIIWAVRLLMTIIWPLFIICTAIVVFRLLQNYDPDEIMIILTKTLSVAADKLCFVLGKTFEFVMSFFD